MKVKIWAAIIAACGTVAAAWVAYHESTEASEHPTPPLVVVQHEGNTETAHVDQSATGSVGQSANVSTNDMINGTINVDQSTGDRTQIVETTINNDYSTITSTITAPDGAPKPTPIDETKPIVVPRPRNVDSDDNDSMLNAVLVDLNKAVTGSVSSLSSDRADWFALNVTEARTVVVKVTNTSPMAKSHSVHAELYGGTRRLCELNWIATGTDNQMAPTRFEPELTYYIKIDAPNRDTSVTYKLECITQ